MSGAHEPALTINVGDTVRFWARDFLMKYTAATDQEALALMSTVGDLRICQIVNPLLGVRACVPKELIAGVL